MTLDPGPRSLGEEPSAAAHAIAYTDPVALASAVQTLASLPPLVTSWEVERLRSQIADAQEGRRFVLQGGDCAETLAECQPGIITNKLKILLQMSLVLVHGGKRPVVRIGRMAGQYAKPRTSPVETRMVDGRPVTLPSYFGDLINGAGFTEQERAPDPWLMVRAYQSAASTLNFVRALIDGGFADLHHPEYWDLSFFRNARLPEHVREQYRLTTERLSDGIRFMEAFGERAISDVCRVEFFTSHEGLNLHYEAAQTRSVPRRAGRYCLTTHFPWIGARTNDPDGEHARFFAGVRNPVGVKLGPSTTSEQVLRLLDRLNPGNEPGKVALITRLGAVRAGELLPGLIGPVSREGRRVLWMCDPMHANTISTRSGVKTRSFDAIREELERTFDAHAAARSRLGGVHFELTGEDVTECIGGASGVTEDTLGIRYESLCDPRLNYQQSLELAYVIASRLAREETGG